MLQTYIKEKLSCVEENVWVTRLSHAANVEVLGARFHFAGDQLVAIAGTFSTADVFSNYPVAVKAQGRVAVKGTAKIKPRRCILKFILSAMTRKVLENKRLIGPHSVAQLMPSKEYFEKSITSQTLSKDTSSSVHSLWHRYVTK